MAALSNPEGLDVRDTLGRPVSAALIEMQLKAAGVQAAGDATYSTRLPQALEGLGGRFAHIVVDTGPIFGVSDAMIVAAQVEGVVLVLRHGRASRDAAQRAIRNLMSVGAKLLGVILNDVDVRAEGYYGYYSNYGYEAEKETA